MVASYREVMLATLLCLASYEHRSTRLLKMLHKHCNTDVLGVLLIYPHSPSGAARPRDHAYISVKPLTAVLQPINVQFYVCAYVAAYSYIAMLSLLNPYTVASYICDWI